MVTTIDFSQSDYNSNMPIFGNPGSYDKKLRFANKSATLTLGNTDYGYGVYSFSYSGSVDYVSISFLDTDGGNVSVSSELNSLYRISNQAGMWEFIIKNGSYNGVTTFNVVVNGDEEIKTERLTVLIAMGKRGTPPVSSSMSITCDCALPLYRYETGVHVYSPYDAIESVSKLKTKLYSFSPMSAWTINTSVYSSSFLQNPAQPYYFGYGDKVFKVGGIYDRSYGTQSQVTTKKKLFGKTKTSTEIFGPQSWYKASNETSDACTMPFLEGVGSIRNISDSSSLVQPEQYRYYLGYNSSVKRESNDSVFTEWSLSTQSHNPIVGATHALSKFLTGLASGYRRELFVSQFAAGATLFGLAMAIPLQAGTSFVGLQVAIFLDSLVGTLLPFAQGFFTNATTWLFALNPWIGVALLLIALILIFSTKTKRYREPCKLFLHHFK